MKSFMRYRILWLPLLVFIALAAAQTPPDKPAVPQSQTPTDNARPLPNPEALQPGKVIDRVVAVVDNEIILESELSQYVQFNIGSQQALNAMRPGQIDTLRRLILDQLINQKVLLAKARQDTLRVEDRAVDGELDSRIKSLLDQAGGQERLEEYYGMPLTKLKRQFRPLVEEGLLIEKVKQEKLKGVVVSPGDVTRFWEMYKDSMPPLKDAVRMAHILLTDAISQSSVDAAIRKADSVRALIVSGKMTLEEYAPRFSDDPASASKGGKLGYTNRGDLVPEYETVAYNLKPGELSQPVRSQFGIHLIRLDERLGEKIATSHILFRIVPTDADRARTDARADSIAKAIRAGANFADLAAKFSTDAKTSPKGGDLGWFAPPEVPAEFKAAVDTMKEGDAVGPLRTQFGAHIVSVTGRIKARPVTLAEDYDRISRMALTKKQDEQFQKWVQQLAASTYIERKL
jgi:peptidyl-prolyl cis-trans isomerase SurA